jgi:hypothetical protein
MIPALNDMLGLPSAATPAELDRATENCFRAALGRAERGDARAQIEVVRLRVAYLNWAYTGQRLRQAGHSRNDPAVAAPFSGGRERAMPPD